MGPTHGGPVARPKDNSLSNSCLIFWSEYFLKFALLHMTRTKKNIVNPDLSSYSSLFTQNNKEIPDVPLRVKNVKKCGLIF